MSDEEHLDAVVAQLAVRSIIQAELRHHVLVMFSRLIIHSESEHLAGGTYAAGRDGGKIVHDRDNLAELITAQELVLEGEYLRDIFKIAVADRLIIYLSSLFVLLGVAEVCG